MMDGAMAGTARQHPAPPAARPSNPSAFNTIEEIRGVSFDVAAKVEEITARLCGDPPPTKDSAGLQAAAFGLLAIGDQHANEVRANLGRIFEAMRRLESQLP